MVYYKRSMSKKHKEQAKENTKKVRQVNQIIKELVKNNKLDLIQDEETKNKLKEVFS